VIQGLQAEALDMYTLVANTHPNNSDGWLGRATLLDRMDKKKEALEAYNILANVRPCGSSVI